jgi:putative ABC transport system permease protein
MADLVYRLLLVLLPGWFREEFGAEMLTVFRDQRTHAAGAAAVALWLRTVTEIVSLAWRLHGEAVLQDSRYAIRSLRRTPTFTIAAVATLAIGLGPTMVAANFVYQVVVAPLPLAEPDQLVRIWNARPQKNQSRIPLSIADYIDQRDRQSAFTALAAHTGTSVAMSIAGSPQQVNGVVTTSDLHEVLQIHPMMGRGLTREDSAPGAPRVMLLGPGLWRTEFGGKPDVVGMVLPVDGSPTTIVGVLPEGFDFPVGSGNMWMPLTLDPATAARGSHFLTATGRLKTGVTAIQAQDDLNAIARDLAATYPDTNAGKMIEVFGLKDQLNGDAPQLLGVLTVAIGAVLLIACLNVASLLTVRGSTRGVELAVRSALGATGRRLRRQLMVEHLMLTLTGGAIGGGLGLVLHRVIVEKRVLTLPRTADTFGWAGPMVLGGLIILIGIAFAWMSASRNVSRPSSNSLLGPSRQTGGRAVVRARQLLVIGEVAAALVLLVTAGLMLQSAGRLAAVNPGFRTNNVLTFGVVLPGASYPQQADRVRFADRVITELRALPGVKHAAVGAYAPMGEMRATRRLARADRAAPGAGDELVALDLPVGPGYFDVMGIPILQGRGFTDADTADAAQVIVVSEELARSVFPDELAIGQRIRFFSSRPGGTPPPPREIVGIARGVRQDGVRQTPILQMYTPYAQTPWGFLSFFVLADEPMRHAAAVQRIVSKIDPMRPARDVLTTEAIVRGSTARQRAMTWMLLALAGLALLLATVGLYGVSATAAQARSRELAIRAAVGAEPGSLMRLVMGRGLVTSLIGVVIGAATSLGVTRSLGSFLYEVTPRDPVTLLATSVVVLVASSIAGYIPARRTLKLNPADVLRSE